MNKFLGELVTATEDQAVPLTERSIERNGSQTPGFVLEAYPWKAKDAKKRLNDLQEELAKIKKAQAGMTADEYERATSAWAGSLSETWERLVRPEVVNKVVDRGTTEVRPKLFRLLARTAEEDDRDFQAGYGEVSEWARRHDKVKRSTPLRPPSKAGPNLAPLRTRREVVDRSSCMSSGIGGYRRSILHRRKRACGIGPAQ
jgi:hypothetical protein